MPANQFGEEVPRSDGKNHARALALLQGQTQILAMELIELTRNLV